MAHLSRNRSLVLALSANAVLLLVIAGLLSGHGGYGALVSSASAAPLSPQPIAGGGGLYLMPAQLLSNVWGCYVMDIDNQTLSAYSFNGNQLKLIASRNIRYDHQLGNYNTHPDPEEIRRLVEIEREKIRGAPAPAPGSTTQQAPGSQQ